MSNKLKTITGKAEIFEAICPGEFAYHAFADASGALHVMQLPSHDSVTIDGNAAKKLIADLQGAARAFEGIADNFINAIQYRFLSLAFDRTHPPRDGAECLDRDAWPVTVPRFTAF
jgi:hypothetical protein